MSPFFTRIIYCSIATYAVSILYMCLQQYIYNYTNSDGLILANGRQVGGDFLSFYIAGKIALTEKVRLYDLPYQYQLQQAFFAGRSLELGALPYVYPPLLTLVFAQLAKLSFFNAYLIWSALSLVCFAISIYLILSSTKLSRAENILAVLLCLSFIPYILDCLGSGQTSFIALLIFSAVYRALKSHREILAGIIFGFGYYKPPLFVVFFLCMLFERRWRFISGSLLSGGILILLSVAWLGIDGFSGYIKQARVYTPGVELLPGKELPTARAIGLYGPMTEIFGFGSIQAVSIYISFILVVLAIANRQFLITNTVNFFNISFSLKLSFSLLLSFHLFIYDLIVIIPCLILNFNSSKITKSNLSSYLFLIALSGLYTEWLFRSSAPIDFEMARLMLVLSCISTLEMFIRVSKRCREKVL